MNMRKGSGRCQTPKPESILNSHACLRALREISLLLRIPVWGGLFTTRHLQFAQAVDHGLWTFFSIFLFHTSYSIFQEKPFLLAIHRVPRVLNAMMVTLLIGIRMAANSGDMSP